MSTNSQSLGHRVPTLVHLCQRGEQFHWHYILLGSHQYSLAVASAHVDCACRIESGNSGCINWNLLFYQAISSLGDDLRFELLEPVLTGCSPETLSRLESTSPVRVGLYGAFLIMFAHHLFFVTWQHIANSTAGDPFICLERSLRALSLLWQDYGKTRVSSAIR